MQQNGGLSVEEILESIKKVIARDNKETAQVERYRRETEGVMLRRSGTNFGLTPMSEIVSDDSADEEDADEEEAGESDEVLDLTEAETDVFAGEDELSADLEEELGESSSSEMNEPLVSEHHHPVEGEPVPLAEAPLILETPVEEVAAPLVLHPFEALTTMPETTASSDVPASAGETPLERMVRESLQPILRDWLDANLEPMVERLVKAELERVMGKLS
jgi:cell pole-organizing protein PopZ